MRSDRRPISDAALRRLGYGKDDATAHGFRATFSTLANESGLWNPDAIERALAHVEGNSVRRAYARGEHGRSALGLPNGGRTCWTSYVRCVQDRKSNQPHRERQRLFAPKWA